MTLWLCPSRSYSCCVRVQKHCFLQNLPFAIVGTNKACYCSAYIPASSNIVSGSQCSSSAPNVVSYYYQHFRAHPLFAPCLAQIRNLLGAGVFGFAVCWFSPNTHACNRPCWMHIDVKA